MQNELNIKIIANVVILFISSMLTYIGITSEVFIAYMVLMFMDYFTGLLASVKVHDDITSEKMIDGALKKLSTLFLILGVSAFIKIVGIDFNFLMYSILWTLAVAELLSLIANIHCMHTGERWKEQIVVTTLIRDIIIRFIKAKGVQNDKLDS